MDPASGREEIRDIFVVDGVIQGGRAAPSGVPTVDAAGMIVAPGLIDIHTHLREPGAESSETIRSGSAAAARGGFTTITAMPNTVPPADTPEMVVSVIKKGVECGLARVLACGCVSMGRKGTRLADLRGMAAAGASAFTDDGSMVRDSGVMKEAMVLCRELGLCIMDHALDPEIAAGGVMREGGRSRSLGLPGIPAEAEITAVRRDIALASETGCKLHIQHVSTSGSIDLLRDARKKGVRATCEVTPHHLTLSDSDVDPANPHFKMNPPLGDAADRAAMLQGIEDGTVTALATDHAPHAAHPGRNDFVTAPFGVVGLETALGATYLSLVESGRISLSRWIGLWTVGPAEVLGLPVPRLLPGSTADVTVIDPAAAWRVSSREFVSKSLNTPFEGRLLKGMPVCVILGGRLTWRAGDGRIDRLS